MATTPPAATRARRRTAHTAPAGADGAARGRAGPAGFGEM